MAFELHVVPEGQAAASRWRSYETFKELIEGLKEEKAHYPKDEQLRVICTRGITAEQSAELETYGAVIVSSSPG